MAQQERKAVLVLPDVGLKQEHCDKLRTEFQNSIVGTLRNAGAAMASVVVVVVVVVVA